MIYLVGIASNKEQLLHRINTRTSIVLIWALCILVIKLSKKVERDVRFVYKPWYIVMVWYGGSKASFFDMSNLQRQFDMKSQSGLKNVHIAKN